MAKRKTEKPQTQINIRSLSFKAAPKQQKGLASITYAIIDSQTEGYPDGIEVDLPLISLWVDPTSNTACKAYMTAPSKPTWDFMKRYQFWSQVKEHGPVMKAGLSLTADTAGIIRYGAMNISSHTSYSDRYLHLHDNKGVLLKHILAFVNGRITLGGTAAIDMDKIPMEILQELGFDEIPDVLGRMPSMWAGNIADIFKSGDDLSWRNQRKNMDSFLLWLDKSLEEENVTNEQA